MSMGAGCKQWVVRLSCACLVKVAVLWDRVKVVLPKCRASLRLCSLLVHHGGVLLGGFCWDASMLAAFGFSTLGNRSR
jgi:hypothetical protein